MSPCGLLINDGRVSLLFHQWANQSCARRDDRNLRGAMISFLFAVGIKNHTSQETVYRSYRATSVAGKYVGLDRRCLAIRNNFESGAALREPMLSFYSLVTLVWRSYVTDLAINIGYAAPFPLVARSRAPHPPASPSGFSAHDVKPFIRKECSI